MPAEVNATKVNSKWVAYAIVSPARPEFRPVRTADGTVFQRRGAAVIRVEATLEAEATVKPSRSIRIFTAMSFRQEEEPALIDYFEAIKRAVAASELPIELFRMDQRPGYYEISQQIMDEISESDALIADFTLSPRNVYFEIGFARGAGKRVIQVARKDTSLEFDLRSWKTLFYKNATELESVLVPELAALYGELTAKDG